jgi:hypothetical protein
MPDTDKIPQPQASTPAAHEAPPACPDREGGPPGSGSETPERRALSTTEVVNAWVRLHVLNDRRLARWMGALVVFLIMALVVAIVLTGRPAPGGEANQVAPVAGGQAGAAGQGGVGQPPDAAAQADNLAGIIPADCKVPVAGFSVELTEFKWQVDPGDGTVWGSWNTVIRNNGTDRIVEFWHYETKARSGAPAPPAWEEAAQRVNNAWDMLHATANPGGTASAGGSTFSLSPEPPPICYYRVVDLVAVVYDRPECVDPIVARMLDTKTDPVQRDDFMDPLRVGGFLPKEMSTVECP